MKLHTSVAFFMQRMRKGAVVSLFTILGVLIFGFEAYKVIFIIATLIFTGLAIFGLYWGGAEEWSIIIAHAIAIVLSLIVGWHILIPIILFLLCDFLAFAIARGWLWLLLGALDVISLVLYLIKF